MDDGTHIPTTFRYRIRCARKKWFDQAFSVNVLVISTLILQNNDPAEVRVPRSVTVARRTKARTGGASNSGSERLTREKTFSL